MIQDKIFFDEKDPTGLSYNTPFTFYGSYQGRLYSKTPTGSIKYYTQNSDLSAYATTGSNQFSGSQTVTGSLTVTGTITGTVAGTTATASYVEYTNVANKPALVSGSSQVTYSGLTGIPVGIVSGSAQVASFGIFATTGSNGFNGSQSITGSLTVSGQVVAQTLNVQQVTSSIVYSSGSNIFGNILANTQQFTGSVSITGSLNTSIAAFGSAATVFLTSDSGTIKSRTAAQTLSDIAALPLAGGTLTGPLTGSSASFTGNALFGGSSALSGLAGGISVNGSTNSGINFRIADTLRGYVYVAGNGSMNLESTSGSVVLSPNGSPALTIASTGAATFSSSVNIGASATTGKQLIVNQTGASGYFLSGEASGTEIAYWYYNANEIQFASKSAARALTFLTTDTERMRITSGGLVGIGTTPANSKLHILKASSETAPNEQIRMQSTGGSVPSTWRLDVDANDGSFAITDNNVGDRMRITSGGAILMNQTAGVGAETLEITSKISGGSQYGILVTGSPASYTNYAMRFHNSGIAIVGSITFTAALVSYNVSSDYRLKQDLKPIKGLDLVNKINVYNYEWKSDKTRMDGVIAHELAEILPYAVTGVKDGAEMQGVDYSKIVPILIKAIQEQQEQIDSLKNQMK